MTKVQSEGANLVASEPVAVCEQLDSAQPVECREQLERLANLGLFATGITHDLNNLLTVVRGSAEALSQGADANLEASPPYEAAQQIVEYCDIAAGLIRQISIYAGRDYRTKDLLDLSEAVRRSRVLLNALVDRRVRIEFDLSSRLPRIRIDEHDVLRTIINLVLNSAHAIGNRQGEIRVYSRLVQASAWVDRPGRVVVGDVSEMVYVSLGVEDNGDGMDEAAVGQVFDPFCTTKLTGSGLGLASIAEIVRRHKGMVRVHSRCGHGTLIEVLFPVVESLCRCRLDAEHIDS